MACGNIRANVVLKIPQSHRPGSKHCYRNLNITVHIMTNPRLSTFEREMQNISFRKKFEKEYKKFLLSEIISALMRNDGESAQELAKE